MRHSQPPALVGRMILVALLLQWAIGSTFAALLQQEFRITKWETEDGLPENSATAMVQTPDGYLWFGTLNGLVRFDGFKFTTFNPLNTPELPGAEIASLHLHPSGRMWISTDKGLASWQDGQWKRHGQNPHWANRVVRSFAGNAAGGLCATGLDGAVCQIRGEEIIELPKPPGIRAAHAHMDAAGNIWALNEEFAGYWDGQRWVVAAATLNLTNSFRCAATARDGGLWVLKQARLIKVKAGQVIESRPLTDTINQVWAMAEDDAGTLWAAGVRAGLFRIGTNGTVAQYRMQDGLTYNALRFAQRDREQNLWVGTSGGGLMRLRARTFQTFDTENSLPTRVVRSVWEERPGMMLLGTHGGGARRLEAAGRVSTVLRTKPTEGYIQAVLADRQQRTWISLHNEGLAVLEAGQERRLSPEQSGGRRVAALFEDTAGRVWIGGNDSVVRCENGQFQRVTTDAGKVVSSVRCFAENPRDGSLWAVTERGLFRLAAGKFQPVNGPGDKPLNEGLCLRFEADGTLWVGTKNLGLLRLQNQRWAALTHHAGLPSDTITSVLEDGLGHFWIASNRGITRAIKAACHAVADGRQTELNAQVFTVSDGLASAECAAGVQPNAATDSQGRLWFATLKGVAVVDPRQVRHNPNPPPVFIERVTYRDHHGEDHELSYTRGQRELTAPPGTERLAIYFTGLNHSAPEKMRFSYTTDESGGRWTDVSDRRMIAVPTPKPGQTQFRLKAANGDGVWNEPGVTLALTVPPFYWQTLWFQVLAGLAVAIGIGGTVWRVQRKELHQQRWELAQERTLASERARLAAVLAASHERAVRQRTAVANLVMDPELNAREPDVALRRLTEILSATLQVERASVWLMSEDGQQMRCVELFEAGPRRHSAGLVLRAADYPRYWLALQTEARVDADDAVSDPRTSEFAVGYLRPLGITSMLDAILLKDGQVAGVVCLEHTGAARHWETDEQSFASTAAALTAQLLATSERRRAEAALLQMRFSVDHAGDSVFWVSRAGRICYANDAACVGRGYTREELMSMTIFELDPDFQPGVWDLHWEDLKQRGTVTLETRHRAKDGRVFPIEVNANYVCLDGEEFNFATVRDITERKRAEQRLRESEQLLDRVVRNINDVLIVDDLAGRVVFANQKFFALFGIADQQLDGIRLEDYVAPEWRARQRELHDRRVRGEAVPDHFECEGLRRDGTRVWIEVSVVPVVEQGRTVGTQSVFRDISERKRAEARIAAFSELGQRLSAADTAAAASAIIVELADRLLGWDSCVVNLYSAAEDRMESVLRKDLIHGQRQDVPVPSADRTVTPRARRVLTNGGELTLREAPDGMPADAVPFGDTARPSRSLLTVPIRDRACPIAILSIQSYQAHAYTPADLELLQALADHCGSALARIQATQALHTSEERFRLVWKNAVDGMRLTDGEGRVVAANPAFCRLMGRPDHEVVGALLSDLYAEPDRARILTRHRERFTQRTVLPQMERRLTLWDGRTVWLAASNCFVETDPARPLLLSILRDITPNRSLEEQLRQSQKMEAIGQLAGGIAHDFNNILGAIVGNVELARSMPPDDPELPVSLNAIHTASQRAAALVKQILAFSRRQEQQRQPLQLAVLVREAIKLLRATVPASVEFEPHLLPVPTVLADPSAIHQVTMNLCTNAWHALGDRPGVIRVELAAVTVAADFARQHPELRPGPYVQLTVADTGCGMDAATLAHIFEPFFTTKPVGAGTGLGLAVVHGIMRTHDGGIVVTSEPGVGTTFGLYFPVFEAAVPDSLAPSDPIPNGSGEHILFVDDETALGKVGRNILMRMGYRVTLVSSPAEALALFQAQPAQFDLVITDNNMPGMSGTQLGAQLLASHPGQRIILTTGFSANITEETARALGFAGLLPKPYDMRSLSGAVQAVLQAAKKSR